MSPYRRKPPEDMSDADIRTQQIADNNETARRILDTEAIQNALRDELRQWLNDQFAAFGKWSLKGLIAFLLAGLVYLWFSSHGWQK